MWGIFAHIVGEARRAGVKTGSCKKKSGYLKLSVGVVKKIV